jgi:hypothetical protein
LPFLFSVTKSEVVVDSDKLQGDNNVTNAYLMILRNDESIPTTNANSSSLVHRTESENEFTASKSNSLNETSYALKANLVNIAMAQANGSQPTNNNLNSTKECVVDQMRATTTANTSITSIGWINRTTNHTGSSYSISTIG